MQLEMMTAEDQQLFWDAYYETWHAGEDYYTEEDYMMDWCESFDLQWD